MPKTIQGDEDQFILDHLERLDYYKSTNIGDYDPTCDYSDMWDWSLDRNKDPVYQTYVQEALNRFLLPLFSTKADLERFNQRVRELFQEQRRRFVWLEPGDLWWASIDSLITGD